VESLSCGGDLDNSKGPSSSRLPLLANLALDAVVCDWGATCLTDRSRQMNRTGFFPFLPCRAHRDGSGGRCTACGQVASAERGVCVVNVGSCGEPMGGTSSPLRSLTRLLVARGERLVTRIDHRNLRIPPAPGCSVMASYLRDAIHIRLMLLYFF